MGGASVHPAVQNFLLACRAEGLGCVLTTLLCEAEPAVRALLDMAAARRRIPRRRSRRSPNRRTRVAV